MAQKQIPMFQAEDEEREFWSREDSCEYVDWTTAHTPELPQLNRTLAAAPPGSCSQTS
jgi:hypothetical protein